MSSRGHTVLAALAVVFALLASAGSASASLSDGLGGYITDADTGLGVGKASVTWNGTTNPPPKATTEDTGRYLFLGLDAGTTGTLSIVGPAGWDRLDVGGVTLPASGLGSKNVELHRDWITPAGGAQVSSTDESTAGAGCGSSAAVDTDRGTGWSVAANHPADAPATLTAQLPQTIDVTEIVLNAAAVCGDPAGAALGRYRVETSPDGTTWTTAAEGTLTTDQRGTDVVISPSGGATGVRLVRLTPLSAQDGAATTIDVRELAIHGLGPNVPPSGTISIDSTHTPTNTPLRLRAAFTDPDSPILRYLWDFDGDGVWDQATAGPTVAHAWAGVGTYHVTVGARDFRGGLGTASMDVRIVDPDAPVEPVVQRKPLITFDPAVGIDVDTRIACSSKCTFTAKLVLSAKTARKLHLKRRVVRTYRKKTEGPGLGSWTLTLPQTTIKRLRHAHLKKVNVQIIATAVDQQHRRTTVKHWVTFR